ncbi:MAG: hypothetical protein WA821_06025 [Anaerolineales bacterium]
MKKNTFPPKFAAIALVSVVLLVLGFAQSVKAATGQICDQYGSTTQGSYIVMNNRWGTTATQCINVTTSGFQIVQQDGVGNLGGSPVSYPAIYVGCHYSNCSPSTNLPMQISAISAANTNVSLTYPGSGTYDAAYDIWLNADTNVSGVQDTEIMIWLNHVGSIQPIGSNTGTVTLGGRSWAVWVGNNGQNNVVSYEGSGITSFNTDVKPFLLDAITRGSGFGTTAWYLTSMQMGFEPWVSGVGLTINSFSAAITGGGSGGPTPTRTKTPLPGPTFTPTRTPTPGGSGGACSPITSSIAAPFTKDGAGTFCWQSTNLGTYVNSWNLTSLTINGANFTNLYVASGSYPAKISGYWYVSYSTTNAGGHFEAK